MKEFLMWLSIQLLIKMASSEWLLGFQIQEFVNLYNADIRNGQYCCCDTSTCVQNIKDITQCSADCDTYFITFFPICLYNETCPNVMYTNVHENSPSTIRWKPVLQLHLDESNWDTKNAFILEAWEFDSGNNNDDDQIDIFKIPMAEMVFNSTHYNSLTVEGENGIGKVTLSYYNITTDTSLCSSVEQPTSSTCSHNQKGSASISGSFSVSTKWMITTLQEATVTKIILPTTTCKMTSDNIKSTLLSTSTFPDISATVTMSAEIALTILMWKTMAILGLVIAVSLAITSIVLGITVYRIRKDTCMKSEPNSKFTIHKGNHPPVNDPATQSIHYHVDNTLYQQASVSDCEYFNTGPTNTQEGNLYDLGSPTAEELASPYEAPVQMESKQ